MEQARDPLNAIVPQYLALAAVLVGGTLLARRRHGTAWALVVCGIDVALVATAAIAFPVWATWQAGVPLATLFAAGSIALVAGVGAVAVALPNARVDGLVKALRRRPRAQNAALVGIAVIAAYFVPLETRIGLTTEDWRRAHVADDDLREPDPVLFWRPVAHYPFNAQGFKSRLMTVPKPPGTLRVICYGDSNTDGPSLGRSWPARLQTVIDARAEHVGRHVEVVNGGVVGYSSYQGLLLFREEVARYEPDVVLFSFGWNDAARAIDVPDKDFARSGFMGGIDRRTLFVQRVLLKYRLLLVARHYLQRATPPVAASAAADVPRVGLADFAANLREFVATARRRGSVPVLMTRPHRAARDQMRDDPTWRRDVPRYADETRRGGRGGDRRRARVRGTSGAVRRRVSSHRRGAPSASRAGRDTAGAAARPLE